MCAGRVEADIAKFLVGSDDPAILLLDAAPEKVIRQPAPSLIGHCYGIATAAVQQLRDFVGQVLVDLKPSGHSLGIDIDRDRPSVSGETRGEFERRPDVLEVQLRP